VWKITKFGVMAGVPLLITNINELKFTYMMPKIDTVTYPSEEIRCDYPSPYGFVKNERNVSDAQVREIRSSSDKTAVLSKKLNIDHSTISKIRRGLLYKDVK
jgi:hypothetical protein